MQTNPKLQQKSYRKGSSLYFSAGLLVTMILVTTAFEWNTPMTLTGEEVIELPPSTTETIDFKAITLPTPPKPKVPEIRQEIVSIQTEPQAANTPAPIPPDHQEDFEPLGPPPALLGTNPLTEEKIEEAKFSKDAVPVGGDKAFYDYIYQNLTVPSHLISQGIDGKVYVSFVVDTDGRLTDIKIVRGFDKRLEAKIIKLLENAPAWEPAWYEGRKAKAVKNLPIVIKITKQ